MDCCTACLTKLRWSTSSLRATIDQHGALGSISIASKSPAMAEGLPKVRVKHSYKAQTDNELSFQKGDILTILEMRDDDW